MIKHLLEQRCLPRLYTEESWKGGSLWNETCKSCFIYYLKSSNLAYSRKVTEFKMCVCVLDMVIFHGSSLFCSFCKEASESRSWLTLERLGLAGLSCQQVDCVRRCCLLMLEGCKGGGGEGEAFVAHSRKVTPQPHMSASRARRPGWQGIGMVRCLPCCG